MPTSPIQRPSLTTLPPSIHGARDHGELARLGLSPEEVIDFSANSNPYAPHPAVIAAVRQALSEETLRHYPDRHSTSLREAIAATDNLPLEQILVTNGASELIQLIALAFVRPDSRHLILEPTFGEYERAVHLMGGRIQSIRPDRPDLRFEIEPVAEAIRRYRPDAVWLCTPNNPTGQYFSSAALARLQAAAPEALWLIDQSYRYFGPDSGPISISNSTIVIRSLTKEHGLAGLRLGYALAPPEIIVALRAVQPPWSVNALAQTAGLAALQPALLAWREQTLAELHRHAAALWAGLTKLGLTVLPSVTPYALVEVGQAPIFRRRLLQQRLLVRDATSFGLPAHIRIAAQRPPENQRLLTAVAATLSDKF